MSKNDIQFDFNQALNDLKAGKPMSGKEGFLTPLIKQLTEAALQAEQEQHLAEDPSQNRKNGYTTKTIKSAAGSFELETPRDRAANGTPAFNNARLIRTAQVLR